MALKFDFSKLRTAVAGFLTGTDTAGGSLAAGEEAVFVPKMRQAYIVKTVNTATTLTAEDSGKIILMNDASGGAYQITLPTAAQAQEGIWFRFVQNELMDAYGTNDINIQDGSINYPKENGEADKKN